MSNGSIPLVAAAAIAMAAGCAPAQPVPSSPVISELAGRTAGPPRRCVTIIRTEALRLAEGQTEVLIYGNGRTIWLNRLRPGCAGLERDDILIIDPIGSQYCRGDRVRSVDPVSRVPGAACILGEFVPYTR